MAQTALGNMFRLLSTAFQPPTERLAGLVVSGALARDIATTWRELDLPDNDAAAFVGTLSQAYENRDSNTVMHELRCENTRLFLGDHPLVENSEGPWRKRAEGKQGAALIVNSYSVEVADFMRSCGIERKAGYNDCIDYVENEFEFAAMLTERGADALELLEGFIAEHLKIWLPGFCNDVIAQTRTPYYRALCELTDKLVDEL